MTLPSSMLHPPLGLSEADASVAKAKLEEVHRERGREAATILRNANDAEMAVSVDTVSLQGNFDAFVGVYLPSGQCVATCILDSGCPALVLPDYEVFEFMPGYTLLGFANEPFGLPAAILEGPICLTGPEGLIMLGNVIFYACTQSNSNGGRTANFGCGCLNPLTGHPWSQPLSNVTIPSPVANSGFRYLNIRYGAANTIFSSTGEMMLASTSTVLVSYRPPSEQTKYFSVIPNLEWMALPVVGLGIGGPDYCEWPGQYAPALIDVGGGPMFLNDPHGYLYTHALPGEVPNMLWAKDMPDTVSTAAPITLTLEGQPSQGEITYTVDTSGYPSVSGWTLSASKNNPYLTMYGMNAGGITALCIGLSIDYQKNLIGFDLTSQPTCLPAASTGDQETGLPSADAGRS